MTSFAKELTELISELADPVLSEWDRRSHRSLLVQLIQAGNVVGLRHLFLAALSFDRVKAFALLLDLNIEQHLQMSVIYAVVRAQAQRCFRELQQRERLEDLMATNSVESMPLPHLAAMLGSAKMLRAKTSLNLQVMLDNSDPEKLNDKYERTPLHYAAMSGSVLCCEECLDFGLSVDKKDVFNQTPLMMAVTKSEIAVIRLLHQKKPSALFARNRFNQTSAIHLAVMANNHEGLEVLLQGVPKQALDQLDADTRTPLHYAALYGHEKCIDVLLSHGANRNVADSKFAVPAHYAAQHSLSALKKLTEAVKEDPKDQDGRTTLMWAVLAQNVQVVKAFVEGDLSIKVRPDAMDKERKTVMHLAALKGNEQICKLLMNANCGTWTVGVTRQRVYAIVQKGDVNSATPIHLAAGAGHTRLLRFFSRTLQDIDIVDGEQKTPLFYACLGGMSHTVQVLVEELEAKVNHVDLLQQTAMHCAVFAGSLPCVQILLQLGCNADKADLKGRTASMLASELGKSNIEMALLHKDVI